MTETLVTTATRCTCAHTPAPDQPAPAESDPVEPGESS
jgi:hypothetical protein